MEDFEYFFPPPDNHSPNPFWPASLAAMRRSGPTRPVGTRLEFFCFYAIREEFILSRVEGHDAIRNLGGRVAVESIGLYAFLH